MALNAAILAALVLAFLCYRYLLHPALLSPLARIPAAHPSASIASLWFGWTAHTNRQARSLLDAHRRRGPVVRVEPNHVSVASLDGQRAVYHVGKFDRSDWWLQLRNYGGTPNLLSMLDSKQHATRRRIVSHVYSKSYLLGSADFRRLAQILLFDRLLPNIDDASKTGKGIDVFELGHAIGAEFAAAYMYGTGSCLDIMGKGKEQKRKAYVTAGKTKVLEVKGSKKAGKFLEDDNLVMCGKAVYALLMESIPEKEGPKTPEETLYLTASELLDNLEAARTGIGGALCYILHELTLQPALQASLRDELMTLDPPLTHPPGSNIISAATLRKLDGLALLNAVILETLRVRNPILLPARRVVPPGGTVIDGFYIPAGTIISMSSYILHMNSDVFPEPDKWIPQRWIGLPDRFPPEQGAGGDDQGEAEKGRVDNDPRRWFWTFLSGSRMCVGNNLATMIMKLAVAGIYTNYTTYIIDDEGIEQLDRMVASPAGDKLILGFNRVPKA